MKKILLIISLVLAVLFVGGWKFLQKKTESGKKNTLSQNSVKNEPVKEEKKAEEIKKEGFIGTLKEALAKKVPLKCVWNQNQSFSGVSYMKNGKYYAEIMRDDKKGYTLMMDNCLWVWDGGNKKGVKMCFTGTDQSTMMDMKGALPSDINYNCKPEIFADSKFEPPADVEFMSFDNMKMGK